MSLSLFEYDGVEVRSVMVDGDPWFVAADLARLLDYRDASNAARLLDADMRGTQIVSTPGGDQRMAVISEPGLYRLIMRSQRPEARQIERWVVTVVLPAIRRTGTYAVPAAPAAPAIPATYAEALRLAADQAEEIDRQQTVIADLEPRAALADAVLDASGDYSVREAAQILSRDHGIVTGQNRLMRSLRDLQWVDGKGRPYQAQIEAGRVAAKVSVYDHPHTGEPTLSTQVRVTPKGLAELHRLLGPGPAGTLTVVSA